MRKHCTVLWMVVLGALITGCDTNNIINPVAPGVIAPARVIVAFEAEPNDTSGTANAVSSSRAGSGNVNTPGDTDFWRFNATAGSVIQIELFGTRFDQMGWDSDENLPKLTLFGTNGTTILTVQDEDGDWSWGSDDLDLPCWYIKATGTYFISITQVDDGDDGGAYGFVVSDVQVPDQFEAEPEGQTGVNDTSATAQPITPGLIYGWHVDDEEDYYSFDITGPTLVYFETKGYRNGDVGADDEYFDMQLYLVDRAGTSDLDDNDDAFWYDSGISYKLTTPGTYYINVTECCGSAHAPYFLIFEARPVVGVAESEPNDTVGTADPIAYGDIVTGAATGTENDCFAFAGMAGDIVRVWVYDSENSDVANDVDVAFMAPDGFTLLGADDDDDDELNVRRTILTETGTHYLQISSTNTDYCFRLERYQGAAFETEPNDSIGTSDSLDADGRAAGVIAPMGDVDVFCFPAEQGELITVYIHADAEETDDDGYEDLDDYGSKLDPMLTIRNGAGAVLAQTSITPPINGESYTQGLVSGLPVAAVSFVAPSTGNFYVDVTDEAGDSGADHYYQIEVR